MGGRIGGKKSSGSNGCERPRAKASAACAVGGPRGVIRRLIGADDRVVPCERNRIVAGSQRNRRRPIPTVHHRPAGKSNHSGGIVREVGPNEPADEGRARAAFEEKGRARNRGAGSRIEKAHLRGLERIEQGFHTHRWGGIRLACRVHGPHRVGIGGLGQEPGVDEIAILRCSGLVAVPVNNVGGGGSGGIPG